MTQLLKDEMKYIGSELDLFSTATRWRAYLSGKIIPCLGDEVLEIGAGIGTNTISLCHANQKRWLCVDPDSGLLAKLSTRITDHPAGSSVEIRIGTLDCIQDNEFFDSILYIDVLEHIQNDRRELERASRHLRQGGTLIIIVPAHQWLYSSFDKAIGHWRRYTKKTLIEVGPSALQLDHVHYLDSAGMIASIANLLLLRQSYPTARQLKFWDNWLIPISVKLDLLLRYKVGKTIIGVWKRPTDLH